MTDDAIPDYSPDFAHAMNEFWRVKGSQQTRADQAGTSAGSNSGGVRGGKHMQPFEDLVRKVVADSGIVCDPAPPVSCVVPGYYRESKAWDVVLQHEGHVLAIIEAKSQTARSLGNNVNNRVEEAIGQAADIWKSYEHELLGTGIRPWVGYLMVLEQTPEVTRPVRSPAARSIPPGMKLDDAFSSQGRAARYAKAFKRLDQERMLDATCFATSSGPGHHEFPDEWLSFKSFAAQLWGRCRHVMTVLG